MIRVPVELEPGAAFMAASAGVCNEASDEFVDALWAALSQPFTDPGSGGCLMPRIVRGNPPGGSQ